MSDLLYCIFCVRMCCCSFVDVVYPLLMFVVACLCVCVHALSCWFRCCLCLCCCAVGLFFLGGVLLCFGLDICLFLLVVVGLCCCSVLRCFLCCCLCFFLLVAVVSVCCVSPPTLKGLVVLCCVRGVGACWLLMSFAPFVGVCVCFCVRVCFGVVGLV